MIKRRQFSIAFLFVVTTLSAVGAWWYAARQASRHGMEHWQKRYLLEYAVGVAEKPSGADIWDACTTIHGPGQYVVLEQGSRILNTTGAGYYKIGIQLPETIQPGDRFDLQSIPNAGEPRGALRRMQPGEVVAMQYGNPSSWSLVSGDGAVKGTLAVDAMTDETATITVDAVLLLEREQVLEIKETFELERTYATTPVDALPAKTWRTRR